MHGRTHLKAMDNSSLIEKGLHKSIHEPTYQLTFTCTTLNFITVTAISSACICTDDNLLHVSIFYHRMPSHRPYQIILHPWICVTKTNEQRSQSWPITAVVRGSDDRKAQAHVVSSNSSQNIEKKGLGLLFPLAFTQKTKTLYPNGHGKISITTKPMCKEVSSKLHWWYVPNTHKLKNNLRKKAHIRHTIQKI